MFKVGLHHCIHNLAIDGNNNFLQYLTHQEFFKYNIISEKVLMDV